MSLTAESMPPTLFPDDWARTRRSDPLTSHEAADSTDPHESHSAVLALLAEHGNVAQFQAEQLLNGQFSPSRIRSAFSELEEAGHVKRLDDTVLTPRGRRAQLWGRV